MISERYKFDKFELSYKFILFCHSFFFQNEKERRNEGITLCPTIYYANNSLVLVKMTELLE